MDMPNERRWLKDFGARPDLKPRQEFLQALDEKMIQLIKRQSHRKRIARLTSVMSGVAAAAVLLAAFASPMIQQALTNAWDWHQKLTTANQPSEKTNEQQSFTQKVQYIQSHLAPNESLIGTDGKDTFVFLEQSQEVVVMTNNVRKTIFSAPIDRSTVNAFAGNLPHLAIQVSKKGQNSELYVGDINHTTFRKLDVGSGQLLSMQGDPLDSAKFVIEMKDIDHSVQLFQSVDWQTGVKQTLLTKDHHFYDQVIGYAKGFVFASPYEITILSGSTPQTITQSDQPVFHVCQVTDDSIVFTKGSLADDSSNSFDHGPSHVMLYDTKAGTMQALLPSVQGSQQMISSYTVQQGSGYLIGNFVTAISNGHTEPEQRQQPGMLQLFVVHTGQKPKLVFQEQTTWDQHIIRFESINGNFFLKNVSHAIDLQFDENRETVKQLKQ